MLSKNTKRVSESRKQFSKTILEQVLQFLVFESTMYILSRLLSSQVLNLQYISCSNNGKSHDGRSDHHLTCLSSVCMKVPSRRNTDASLNMLVIFFGLYRGYR